MNPSPREVQLHLGNEHRLRRQRRVPRRVPGALNLVLGNLPLHRQWR